MRLVNGATAEDGNAQYGRLQVFGRGGWGAVCDPVPAPVTNGVNQEIDDATVGIACRELGFLDGVKTQLPVRLPLRGKTEYLPSVRVALRSVAVVNT